MNNNQKVWLRALSVFVAGLWVVLGLANGWPLWVWILLAAISLAAPPLVGFAMTESVLRRKPIREPQEEMTFEAPSPRQPEPPRPQSFPVNDVVLRSAREDYQFLFSCTVFWLPCGNVPGSPHAKPGALAANAILEEVTHVAATARPDDASRAEYQVMSALGVPRIDRTGGVQAWADQISLKLDDKDADRLKRLSEVRKDEEVWEYERSYERNVRAYLGDDVLTSTGSALVWWLAGPRTEEKKRVNEAVEHIANLRQLTRTAAGTEDTADRERSVFSGLDHEGLAFADPGTPARLPLPFVAESVFAADGNGHGTANEPDPSVSTLAVSFLDSLPDTPERAMFARQTADTLRAQGFSAEADTVLRRFDAPSSSDPDESERAGRTFVSSGTVDDSLDERAGGADEQEESEPAERSDPSPRAESGDMDLGSAEAALGS